MTHELRNAEDVSSTSTTLTILPVDDGSGLTQTEYEFRRRRPALPPDGRRRRNHAHAAGLRRPRPPDLLRRGPPDRTGRRGADLHQDGDGQPDLRRAERDVHAHRQRLAAEKPVVLTMSVARPPSAGTTGAWLGGATVPWVHQRFGEKGGPGHGVAQAFQPVRSTHSLERLCHRQLPKTLMTPVPCTEGRVRGQWRDAFRRSRPRSKRRPDEAASP